MGPDFLKKVKKTQADVLAADEEYLGATLVLPRGTAGRQVGFGVGGVGSCPATWCMGDTASALLLSF